MSTLIALALAASTAPPQKKAETCPAKPFSFAMPALAKPKPEPKKPAPAPVKQAERKSAPKAKSGDCLTEKPGRG
jgi:hypothetical protein